MPDAQPTLMLTSKARQPPPSTSRVRRRPTRYQAQHNARIDHPYAHRKSSPARELVAERVEQRNNPRSRDARAGANLRTRARRTLQLAGLLVSWLVPLGVLAQAAIEDSLPLTD